MKIGFTSFDSPVITPAPSLRDQVKALTDDQRQAILDSFAKGLPPAHIDHVLLIPKALIDYMYEGIDAIEAKCRQLMRGEVVLTEEVKDSSGEVTTPATYNKPPIDIASLRDAVRPYFIENYPALFINNVIGKVIDYSRYTGKGNFAFYAKNIVK